MILEELNKRGITEVEVLFELIKLYADQYNINLCGNIKITKTQEVIATYDTKKNKLTKL